jgi:hypothetical protein
MPVEIAQRLYVSARRAVCAEADPALAVGDRASRLREAVARKSSVLLSVTGGTDLRTSGCNPSCPCPGGVV